MLKFYKGRENVDKEKFIYGQIKASGKESLVLVPNQYTLVAEEQAIRHLETKCLYDVEILSMNRLGHRIMTEMGLESTEMISKYGRFMLLTKLIRDHKDELELFSNAVGKISFTTMVDDFIVSFKQQNCSREDFKNLADEDSIFGRKIVGLSTILDAYEEAISGRYTDSEDYINMYVDAIKDCRIALDKQIWIYGYDSITPKFIRAMFELSKVADSVNLIINESDFKLEERVLASIKARAAEAGIEIEENDIPEEYLCEKHEDIVRIEKGIFAGPDAEIDEEYVPENVELVCCANQYYEAESASAYIYKMIRDEGYELSDIAVICNSEDELQPIVKRTLQEYGLPVFVDSSRKLTETPGVIFVVNLLGAVRYPYNTNSIMAMLKTGLTEISADETEQLENYARNYRIRGTMWDHEFKYGLSEYGEDGLASMNELRQKVSAPITKLIEIAKNVDKVGGFVDSFTAFLEEEYKLSRRNDEKSLKQEERGLFDEAQKARVGLDEAIRLLGQMKEILGDYPFDIEEMFDIYTAGLISEEIGIIPPTLDGLPLGTLIRTRPRPCRAVLILGANEGVLPLQPSTEGLFSVDEKALMSENNFALGDLDDLKMAEENAAMYRMIAHPSEKLYISYSLASARGDEMQPSSLVDSLKGLFPALRETRDIVSSGWEKDLVNGRNETMRHLVNHLKDRHSNEKGDLLTKALLAWYRENEPEMLQNILDAATASNEQKPLGKELAKRLYTYDGEYKMTASVMYKYFSCPFSYFVESGLKAQEERVFKSDARSIGDMYHMALEEVAKEVLESKKKGEPLPEEEDLKNIIDNRIIALAGEQYDGLFLSNGEEEFRLERIKEICLAAAKAVLVQIESGAIEEMLFEEDFGEGCDFPELVVDTGSEKVKLRGRVDRIDIMEGDRIRIVDYKTGDDTVNVEKMKKGYKMQLAIYLQATTQDKYEPAGFFYFNIKEMAESLNSKSQKQLDDFADKQDEDKYKLDGCYINDPGVAEAMPTEVIRKKNKEAHVLSRMEYEELMEEVTNRLQEFCGDIVEGRIDISPLRQSNRLDCGFCKYKAICRFEDYDSANKPRVL